MNLRNASTTILVPMSLAACATYGDNAAYFPPTTYTVAAPAAATAGSNTTPVQPANPGGPSFTGTPTTTATPKPTSGTNFALTQSAMAVGATSITADATTNSQGATLTYQNNPAATVPVSYQLSVPGAGVVALNLDDQGAVDSRTEQYGGGTPSLNVTLLLRNFDYVAYGYWQVDSISTGATTNFGQFYTGFQTPVGAMPTTGTATFNGDTLGVVVKPVGAGFEGANLTGTAAVNVNFASGAVTASLTSMTATPNGGFAQAWNNVNLTGTITGNTFAGTSAASSAPGGGFSLTSAATGTVTGGFFGPAANEVGAVWTLSDSTGSAIGSLGAKRTIAVSDRRLKRKVRAEGRRADGLRLYSYCYLGDDQRFTGVMAQDLLDDPRFASAVIRTEDDLLVVDYAQLGLEPDDLPAMQHAGFAAMAAYRQGL